MKKRRCRQGPLAPPRGFRSFPSKSSALSAAQNSVSTYRMASSRRVTCMSRPVASSSSASSVPHRLVMPMMSSPAAASACSWGTYPGCWAKAVDQRSGGPSGSADHAVITAMASRMLCARAVHMMGHSNRPSGSGLRARQGCFLPHERSRRPCRVPHPQARDGLRHATSPTPSSVSAHPTDDSYLANRCHIDAALWTVASRYSGEPGWEWRLTHRHHYVRVGSHRCRLRRSRRIRYVRRSDKEPQLEKRLALTLLDAMELASVLTYLSIWRAPPPATEWLGALLRPTGRKFLKKVRLRPSILA